VPLCGAWGFKSPLRHELPAETGQSWVRKNALGPLSAGGRFVFKRAAGASRYFILGTVTTGDLRRQLVARTSERRELLEDVET
jgi:hypothetical protein